MAEDKTCFVIAPIGKEGSKVRRLSNQLLDFVIKPAVESLGYKALRADEIEASGLINYKVIRCLDRSPLVIANLTGITR